MLYLRSYAVLENSWLFDILKITQKVVQTFNRTSLSDRAAYRVLDFGNPAKIQGKSKKYHVPPAPP